MRHRTGSTRCATKTGGYASPRTKEHVWEKKRKKTTERYLRSCKLTQVQMTGMLELVSLAGELSSLTVKQWHTPCITFKRVTFYGQNSRTEQFYRDHWCPKTNRSPWMTVKGRNFAGKWLRRWFSWTAARHSSEAAKSALTSQLITMIRQMKCRTYDVAHDTPFPRWYDDKWPCPSSTARCCLTKEKHQTSPNLPCRLWLKRWRAAFQLVPSMHGLGFWGALQEKKVHSVCQLEILSTVAPNVQKALCNQVVIKPSVQSWRANIKEVMRR